MTESLIFKPYKHAPASLKSANKRYITTIPSGRVLETDTELANEFDGLEGNELKIIMPSNILDFWTRLEILLGLKLNDDTVTLTEASILRDEIYKKRGLQYKQQYRKSLDRFHTEKMELPIKVFKQFAFNTRPMIEEHILIVMDKSIHEEHLFQSLQTNTKPFKTAIKFLTGYNGIFTVASKNMILFSQNQLLTKTVSAK